MADFISRETTFIEFISKINTVYRVPKYQRDYSWNKDQWEELWQDILSVSTYAPEEDRESSHYLGYIVIKKTDSQSGEGILNYDIIDGQQRIATLSLLTLAVIKVLEDLGHNTPAINLRQKYIGLIETKTGAPKNKLVLNINNESYYKNRLSILRDWEQVHPDRPSNKLLKKAFDFFLNKIEENNDLKNNEDALVDLIEITLNKVIFTEMTVLNEEKAYKLFETLNARGVQLSAVDLLKNYLFSLAVNDDDLETMEDIWGNLYTTCKTDKQFKDFVRYHWNSEYKYSNQKDLFKNIKKEIKVHNVFDFVRNLQSSVETFALFSNLKTPDLAEWNNDKEFREKFEEIDFLGATQPYSFLVAMKRRFISNQNREGKDFKAFKKIIHWVNVLTFRLSKIGDINPNEVETFYKTMLAKHKDKPLEEIRRRFSEFLPSDVLFKTALLEKQFDKKNETLAKYILAEMEFYKNGARIHYKDSNVSLEHIEAVKSRKVRQGDVKHFKRLGNLCLLETKANQEISNAYDAKNNAYKASTYELTSSICLEENGLLDWSDEKIEARTKELARLAVEIWKI